MANLHSQQQTSGEKDLSAELMATFLRDLPPLVALPSTAEELNNIAAGRVGFKIPLPASTVWTLQRHLAAEELENVKAVHGYHCAVARLAHLVLADPMDLGSELTSSHAIIELFAGVFDLMTQHNLPRLSLKARANKTEKGAGSSSQAVVPMMRPDELFVFDMCIAMLCEDKEQNVDEALAQLQEYCKNGLPASHYGTVPGIPALATANLVATLCFVPRQGKVSSTMMRLDLKTVGGRFAAVCCAINLYRLFVLMSKQLPPPETRKPLWFQMQRGDAIVMLTPSGAEKHISRFKAYAQKAGTSHEALQTAYKAAAEAASPGRKQFLVTASVGPTFGRGGYRVHTQPLGFYKTLRTEQDCKRLGWACCKALEVLHGVGITHTDIRPENTVWLGDDDAMLIDLEHCRFEDSVLPTDLKLSGWDAGTLHEDVHGKRYTFSSDMYSLGQMLRKELPENHSTEADDFTEQLITKQLTATQALNHCWLL